VVLICKTEDGISTGHLLSNKKKNNYFKKLSLSVFKMSKIGIWINSLLNKNIMVRITLYTQLHKYTYKSHVCIKVTSKWFNLS